MKLLDQINNLNISPEATKTLIEFFVQEYKNSRGEAEDLESQNKEKKEEIKNIEARLENIGDLLNSKKRLEKEIERFGGVQEEEQRLKEISQIKASRIKYVFQALKAIKTSVYNNLNNVLDSQDRSFIVGKGILFLLLINAFSSIVFYFIKPDNRILTLGFLGLALNLLAFILINLFNSAKVENIEGLGINYAESNGNSFEQLINKLDKNQDKFLVNSSWVGALKKERDNIDIAMHQKLGGVEYDELLYRIETLKNEIEANELAMTKQEDKILTTEEYLSLRRELDILSIELEDIHVEQSKVLEELRQLNLKGVAQETGSFRKLLAKAQPKFHFTVS